MAIGDHGNGGRMIELRDDELVFSFPEVHRDAVLREDLAYVLPHASSWLRLSTLA